MNALEREQQLAKIKFRVWVWLLLLWLVCMFDSTLLNSFGTPCLDRGRRLTHCNLRIIYEPCFVLVLPERAFA